VATSLIFDLLARDRASDAFKKVGKASEDAGRKVHGLGGAFGAVTAGSRGLRTTFGLVGRGAALAAGAAGIGGLIEGFKGVYQEAREAQKVSAQTNAVIKSTGGVAKVSATQVGALATAISNKVGVDDEAIQSGANLLLTFTGIRNEAGKGNDVFNRATQTITDMAAAMNQGKVTTDGLKTSSIQVGKALQDPIKGITALRKVGVSFTDQQQKQIKAMVAAGDTLGAQKIILGELNKEFGGSAAAGTNAMQKLGVIFGNIKEQVGTALLPVIDGFANWLAVVLPAAVNVAGAAFSRIGKGFKALYDLLVKGDFTKAFAETFHVSEDAGVVDFLFRVRDAIAQVVGWIRGTGVNGVKAFWAALKEGDVTSDGFVGAMERIGVFVRQAGQFIQRYILPPLARFGGFIRDQVLPALGRFLLFIGPVIGRALAAFGHWIMGTAVPALQRFGGFIRDTVIPAAVRLGGFLAKNLGPTFVALGQFIVQRVWPALQGLFVRFQQIWPTIQRVIVIVAKLVGFLIGLAVVVLGKVLPVIIKLAGPVLTLLFAAIGKIIGIAVKLISTFITAATWLVNSGRKIITGLVNGLVAAWRTVTTWLTERKKAITDRFAAAVTWLVSAGRRILGGLWDGLKAIWVTVFGWIGGIRTSVRGIFAKAGGWLYDKGRAVLGGLWDGLKSIWTDITKWISGLTGWIKDHKGPPSLDRNLLVQAGKDIMGGFFKGLKNGGLKALGVVQDITGNITDLAVGRGSTASGAMQQMVAGYASMLYGWTGSQWTALRALLMGESGFNPNAQNPTSSAYGLFQFLDSTWGFVNAQKTSNPQGQTLAGLRYIKQVYGNPVNAFSAWLNRTPHWYGAGLPPTVFSQPTLIGVGERGPETVSVTPHNRPDMLRPGGRGGGNTYNISVSVPLGANPREVGRQLVEAIKAYEKGSGTVLVRA